jgi:Tol biopolymer transport system component
MDIDGNNLKQLTNSPEDSLWYGFPDFTPDSKWVVYSKSGASGGIWKVPIEGGEPVRINTAQGASPPAVSPDGKMLAYQYTDASGRSGVEVVAIDGSTHVKRFNIATQEIRWARDSRSFLYIRNENGVSNLWSQSISAEPPKQITHFSSELIQSFDLSRDGKQLVMGRGTANRDVVLIREAK